VVVELILGEKHKNLPVEMVKRLLRYHPQVRLVEAGKSGRNALDFVLAYRVGLATVADPQGYFHIVSRDTGFDALIGYLRTQKILARRDNTFATAFETELPLAALSIPATDRPKLVIERLTKNKTNRPHRQRTLLSQINSYFGKKLTDAELGAIVEKLIKQQIIEVGAKGEVSYKI
jgi:hypothetical protein